MFQRYHQAANLATVFLRSEIHMRPKVPETIIHQLEKRKSSNSFRELKQMDHLVDFSSNDYLGLARNTELRNFLEKRNEGHKNLSGGTGSRLISGQHRAYQEVEAFLSTIFRSEKVLLYNSGYAASQGVVSAIPQRGDTILYDQLAHVCLKEGAWLSKAESSSFKHNDLDDLERKLSKSKGQCYVVTETVFSMDGDLAPVESICQLCEKYQAWLIVDEAHSTGLYGENGGGLLLAKGLQDRVLARIYTFGKGMGLHGAAVAGREELINYLINFSRTFIYTTSLPPASILAIKAHFEFLSAHQDLMRLLSEKINLFKAAYPEAVSDTAVQPILISGNEAARTAAGGLQGKGFDVRAILSPTVQEGAERLRVSLHVHNTDAQIKQLAAALLSIRSTR